MISLSKLIKDTGKSQVTFWRWRKKGWLTTVNIQGQHFVTQEEWNKFTERAKNGEFSKTIKTPYKHKKALK